MNQRAPLGYTLIELSLVIALLGVLAIALCRFGSLSSQRIEETDAPGTLGEANQALLGFIAANHRLPCPDTSTVRDGFEHCDGNAVGGLPFVTLGLARGNLGSVRYGVFRSGTSDIRLDVARDRFAPLVATARDTTTNMAVYSSSDFPSLVATLASLMAISDIPSPTSDQKYHHLGSATVAETLLGKVNGIDFCRGLQLSAKTATSTAALNIRDAGGAPLRNVAYALALPGRLDKDGDGERFDASNSTATTNDLAFSAPAQAVSATYDDSVLTVDFGQLFDRLSCATILSPAGHTHFNTLTATVLGHAGFINYKTQLQLAEEMAFVNVTLATSAVVAAQAGVLSAAAAILFATADTMISAGSLSAELALAIADEVLAAAALIEAQIVWKMTVDDWAGAIQTTIDFESLLSEVEVLEDSVRQHAVAADAAGLY